MHDMDVKKIEKLCRRLTFTLDEMKTILYIVGGLPLYKVLDSIDRQKALTLVSHADFEHLRAVYIAVFSEDIKKSNEIIAKISTFSAVWCRIKEINQIIQSEGLVGREFGLMLHTVIQWLFEEYDQGITHSTTDIELFVKEHKE